MSAPPLRRGERGGNYDYYSGHPSAYVDPRAAYVDPRAYEHAQAVPRRAPTMPTSRHYYDEPPAYEQPPPRRHRSERRRPISPDLEDDYGRPRRHGRRGDPVVVNSPPAPRDHRRHPRAGSPPPLAPSPPGPDGSRHGRDRGRERDERRSRHHDRNSMPPPASRDPYALPIREPRPSSRSRRPPPAYHSRGEPEPRRRSRHASPPRDIRPPRTQTFPERPGRRFDDPPSPRRRPRSHVRDDPPSPRRRPRSHGRDDRSPARGRQAATAAGAAGGAAAASKHARRNSMPANFMKQGMKQGKTIWSNPMVQAGARNAFTAGAQAALRSKNDKGPWLGAKGAKVATAALGAAFIDGILGQKHPDSARHQVAKEGYNAALEDIDKGKLPGMKRR